MTVVILAAGTTAVQAQPVGFGARAGVNISWLGGESNENMRRVGAVGGLFVPFELTRRIQVQPELLFSQQGTKIEENLVARYNYILFPLVVRVLFDQLGLEAGPQIAILRSANLVSNGTAGSVKSQLRELDFGIVAGANYTVRTFSTITGVRYSNGFLNTLKDPPAGLKFTNRTIQIYIGYLLE